ncbi:MAG TPA: permease-like cell division protein FtsX [Candidatus Acidoferrales bacterium]|nr:permease-like cell division protein FtsX [Candidatus Acidoferrales bacterium]
MDSGKVKFFLGEVLRNFTRNAGMQVTAVGTVAMTIILLGAFVFVRQTLAGVGKDLLNQIEISVYFKANATTAQEDALRGRLQHDPRIQSTQFIPRKEGLTELSAQMHDKVDTSLLTANPLPDKLRVWVKEAQNVPVVAREIQTQSGVDAALYPQDVVARLLQLGEVLRRVGIGVIALFLVVAGVIISNTIRLTVFARRREISIMQLVGATNMYIRAPFICEGLLDGVVGALVAVLVLTAVRYALWPKLLLSLPWIGLSAAPVNGPVLVAELLATGAAIGVLASWISVDRHLRT